MIAASRIEDLGAAYRGALADFLREANETALAVAYELGRKALEQGLGVVDWATIHGDALVALDRPSWDAERLDRANAFFRESLSPFEMTQRGYAENNRWLERLNQELISEIAKKERLAAQLREANGELEAFSYSVAHDLRAPLRHISAFGKILGESSAGLDEAGRHALDRVQRAVQRMNELIDGLLVLSRVTTSQPSLEPIDLATIARPIVERLRELEPDRTVDVSIADRIPAAGDRRLLSVVLENLLGNAWKFTGKTKDARIEVGVDSTRTPPVYYVRDNGAGFDMAQAARLFGVFQRLHTEQAFPGTGIGLATVQRVVRRHGGKIWAQAAPGAGAAFFFTLAADPHGAATPG